MSLWASVSGSLIPDADATLETCLMSQSAVLGIGSLTPLNQLSLGADRRKGRRSDEPCIPAHPRRSVSFQSLLPMAHPGFRGGHAKSRSISELSSAFPRFRVL